MQRLRAIIQRFEKNKAENKFGDMEILVEI